MRIKSIELKNFKRFTHLTVDSIPETAKLVVLVGPNGSGKTSFMEAMNHFYKYSGYQDIGDFHYLSKTGNSINYEHSEWYNLASKMVNIHFHDLEFANKIGRGDVKGHFYLEVPIGMSQIFKSKQCKNKMILLNLFVFQL